MAPLTWREVSAPNFSSVNQAQALVGDSLSQASKILQSSVAALTDQRTRENTANFMGQIAAGTPLDQVQGVNPAYLDPEAFKFALDVKAQQDRNALGYAALASKVKIRGGGGSGTSGDTIPVAPGASDGNFLTADNQIVQGNVSNAGTSPTTQKGKTSLIPIAPTVTAPNQPAPQSVVPTEEFAPMPSGGPLRSDAAPVSSNASKLFADAVSTYGAPVGPDLRPTPGALRGATVKGTDGGAQIFPEAAQDLGNIANAAVAGDYSAANQALTTNERLKRTLTPTNIVTTIDKNLERADKGFDLRAKERKDINESRQQSDADMGRSLGNTAVQGALDRASALASLPTDLSVGEFAKAKETIDEADRNGMFQLGDPNRPQVVNGTIIPPGNNAAVIRSNLIASMTSTEAGAKNVQDQLSTPEGAAKFNAAIDAAISKNTAAGRGLEDQELQHTADIQKYDLDRNSNPDVPFIKDFVSNLKSDADAGTVAKEVMRNPRFEGSTVSVNDMASLIERTAADAGVSPAIAGGMVANSLRGGRFGDSVKGLFYNGAELTYDPQKLERLKAMTRDPISGKPNNTLLNSITALNQSDKQRDNFNASWEQLKKAQNQYNEDVGQNALKDNQETRRLVALSKAALDAASKQYYEDRAKFLAVGGVTTQNRGEPAAPGKAIPLESPQQGPRAAPSQGQSRASTVLQDAINGGRTITVPPALGSRLFGF